ncbi:MAG: transposase [Lentisphaerae bacterium]|nr:transposase [Lentisphaerota bacterium]
MAIILPNKDNNEQAQSYSDRFIKQAKIGTFLHQANIRKESGQSPLFLFGFIFSLVFQGKNLYRTLESKRIDNAPAKDAVYRFLNRPTYNWRKFLITLSSFLIKTMLLPLTSEDRNRVLILDDSTYSRNRSKSVELLARVYDHSMNRYLKGFRMLTLGWSDGGTFMPLAFSLLSSDKEKNRYQELNQGIDKRTVGYRRRREAMQKSTETMFSLLAQVNPLQLCASTLLFDSWFAFPSIIKRVLTEHHLHVVCMLKDMHRVYYNYNGSEYTLGQLYKHLRKRRGRAKILSSVVVGLGKAQNGEDVPARIIFVRDRNRSKKWLAILTTNLELSDEEAIRIYGKRWEIECFFKVIKSHLQLAKEFQCRSYDALIAHTTIVFVRYIMLAISAREEKDLKTLGELFYLCCDEIEDIRFAEAILIIMELFATTLSKEFLLSEEQVQQFLDAFFEQLPAFLKSSLQIRAVA